MELTKFTIFTALTFTLVLINSSNSANILVISFFSRKSHKITYMPLVEELGKRGHNITLVSPQKPFKTLKNVREIYTMDAEGILRQQNFNVFEAIEKGERVNPSTMARMMNDVCAKSYNLPQVKALVNEKFDLVFIQLLFNDCLLGLAYKLQVPFVLFNPVGINSFDVSKVGGHFPSSFTPNVFGGVKSAEMDFLERFLNFWVDLKHNLHLKYVYEPSVERIYREKLGQDIPSINEIMANASLILSNTHFTLTGPKPYLPDVVDVGGIHSRPATPIPKELEDFIRKGKDGFILFSMGSAIKEDMMPEGKRQMILNTFSKLKQQVLWKWDSKAMPNLPNNVKLSKWLPQQDLLGHPEIKMFITHCGGGSTEEAIYHGVPLIGLPIYSDQPGNANLAKKHGMIQILNWNELNEENFLSAINEILTNSKYRGNAKKISTLFKDRPIDPLENGVYWIEYVLRHKGAPHLRSAGRKLNYFQYHSYDVILAYLVVIGTSMYIALAMLRLIFRKMFCGGVKPKVSKTKKMK